MLLLEKIIPVTNAFCSCPLNPVAQGLTTATLLLRQKRKPVTRSKSRAEPPITEDSTKTWWWLDFDFLTGTKGLSGWLRSEGWEAEAAWGGESSAGGIDGAGGREDADGDKDGLWEDGEGDGDGDGAFSTGGIFKGGKGGGGWKTTPKFFGMLLTNDCNNLLHVKSLDSAMFLHIQ